MTIFNVHTEITQKIGNLDLWFMCSAHCFIELYIYVKLLEISQIVFNSHSGRDYMVEMAIFNVQRAITPKVGNPKLCFMCSALLYICVKFLENISNDLQLTQRTRGHGRNDYIKCSNSKSRKTRVMVHVTWYFTFM